MANGLIGKITAGGGTHLVASTAYFTCATAAGTAAKIAKAADTGLDSATLITGLTVYVKFENGNTAANPTLTLQSNKGSQTIAAKSIKRYGTTAPGTNGATSWIAGAVVALTYDGTNWLMTDVLNNYKGAIGNCTTAAATAEKTVAIGNFVLEYGSEVYVTFSYTNTGGVNPTLNVNSTGAHEIRYKGVPVFKQGLMTDFVYHFIYDGTYWQLLNQPALSYATCTSAANAAKAVTCNGFILYPGATIDILFTNDNTVKNPTLNINSTGAKPILWMNIGNTKNNRDTVIDNIASRTLRVNHLYRFVYDGTNYRIVDDTFRHITASGRTAREAITYTQEDYDEYVSSNGGAPSWAVGDVKTAAVSEVVGYEVLGLGNEIASNQDGGATGRINLYGNGTGYHVLCSAKETAGYRTMYLPDYAGDGYLTHTANANAVGSVSEPVYVAEDGRLTKGSKYAGGTAVTLNSSNKAALTANFYAPTSAGKAGEYLKSGGNNTAPSWAPFTKPTVSWEAGTAAGPKLKVTTDGGDSTAVAVPSANGTTASGIVTTGDQSFGGKKTFLGGILLGTQAMTVTGGKVSNIGAGQTGVFKDGIAMSNPKIAADAGWIRVTGTGEGDTVLEMAVGDDAGVGEKIVARQYNISNAVAKEAVLLGINGVTSFPVSVTSPSFIGDLTGNATSATGFKAAKTIALTGNVTGSDTGGDGSNGWSIDTTINDGAVTNSMLAGSIANEKLANSKITIANNEISLGGSLDATTLRTSLGLSSAMHFIGIATVAITDGSTTNPTITGYTFGTNGASAQKGDVVIDKDSAYEFVWTGSKWERLGPDASYALSNHTHDYLPLSGGTVTGTLVLSKNQDLSGTANNSPALIIGGAATAAHIEVDPNEIQAKTNGTTPTDIYINTDGGIVHLGKSEKNATSSSVGDVEISGGLAVNKKIWLGSGNETSSNANNGSQLIISSSDTGAGGNVALELWRGTNASWQISNEQGYLHFRNNYTTARQTTYSVDTLKLDYNTGDATFKRNIFGGGDAVFNGSVTVGGNTENTSGARMVYNSTEKTLDFVFA